MSNLPFETTPVFFNASVLTKYKSDPDKYKLTDAMLSCRSAWSLECYHLNDKGQVFTYLIYLSRLPHKEQQHWKQFNEKPNGGISRSAYLSDFKGEVDFAYEPMQSIKQYFKSDMAKGKGVWKLKNSHLIDQLHYPLTDVRKEWAEAIDVLNKIINEGFSVTKLRELLQKNNMKFKDEWRSIKLIKEYLGKVKGDLASQICEPLSELNELRVKCAAHVTGNESNSIYASILRKHGTPSAHFRDLLGRCDRAFRLLIGIINN